MPNDNDLFAATEKAYDMVFKGIVDFSSIKAGLELGLFEALADGPRDLASLAETTGSVPPRLEKLLITMSQIGLARQHEGLWSLTNFSEHPFANWFLPHELVTCSPQVSSVRRRATGGKTKT